MEKAKQGQLIKRILILFIIPFFLILLFDTISKTWAHSLLGFLDFGLFNFTYVQNHGAVLGLYSNVPKFIFIVTLSTAATFLFCVALSMFYFLPQNLIALPLAISFLISGIIGNAFDRVQNGFVTDFIAFRIGNTITPYLNVADFSQWISYLFFAYALTFGASKIWRVDESRSKLVINKVFQLRFCLSYVLATVAVVSILGIFSYTFIKYTVMTYGTYEQHLDENILRPFLITFFSTVFILILFVSYFSLVMSHKIAGPIYAFERTLRAALSGNKKDLKLREKDAFKEQLEPLAKDLSKALS
jgi:signal peptidase II